MYLQYLIQENAIRSEIESNETLLFKTFQETFSESKMYDEIIENLDCLIIKDDISKTYDNIKTHSKNYALMYLTSQAKSICNQGV